MGTDLPTLAELMGDAGYRTLAVTTNRYASELFGLTRGFEAVEHGRQPAEGAVDDALELLEAGDGPFLLYVHLIDLHAPIRPPEPWRNRYAAADGEPHQEVHEGWRFGAEGMAEGPEFERFRSHKLALYDGAIAYLDHQVARLQQAVEAHARGPLVWVLASDHGEEFWDHLSFAPKYRYLRGRAGSVGHGHSMLGEVTDVPLIFHGHGVPRRAERAHARNLDLVPTVLGLVGLDGAGHGFRGNDLFAAERPPAALAYSEDIHRGLESKAVSDGRYTYLEYTGVASRPAFLWDRVTDPEQREDRLADLPEEAARLRRELEALRAPEGRPASGPGVTLGAEEEAELRALGYLE